MSRGASPRADGSGPGTSRSRRRGRPPVRCQRVRRVHSDVEDRVLAADRADRGELVDPLREGHQGRQWLERLAVEGDIEARGDDDEAPVGEPAQGRHEVRPEELGLIDRDDLRVRAYGSLDLGGGRNHDRWVIASGVRRQPIGAVPRVERVTDHQPAGAARRRWPSANRRRRRSPSGDRGTRRRRPIPRCTRCGSGGCATTRSPGRATRSAGRRNAWRQGPENRGRARVEALEVADAEQLVHAREPRRCGSTDGSITQPCARNYQGGAAGNSSQVANEM